MIGLRAHARDAQLPAAAGDEALTAPDSATVAAVVELEFLRDDSVSVAATDWNYARWKPGVSITCGYDLTLSDERHLHVVAKRYADGKDRLLAERDDPRHTGDCSDLLRMRWWIGSDALVLSVFPMDRELPGLAGLRDNRRLARMLEEAHVVPARSIRRRTIEYEPLRYKPERRCVARIDMGLRSPDVSRLTVAARIHPRAAAARIATRRRVFAAAGGEDLAPRLLAYDAQMGLLLEEWLDVSVPPSTRFDHAYDAGALVAALHRLPLPASEPERAALRRSHDAHAAAADRARLFRVDPTLVAPHNRRAALVSDERSTWVHGDLHADQVGQRTRRAAHACDWSLLDLDCVGVGDPLRDLASWIADDLNADDARSPHAAAESLLCGYAENGGERVSISRLWSLVREALVDRAAASIRRLERDAIPHARRSLERAKGL